MANNVLLVDDEMLVIEAIRANVDWEACNVSGIYLCDNVNDAKDIFEKEEIKLVISDIEMPGEDGIKFVSWIREQYPDTSVIFLTGYAEFEYAKAAVSLRVEEYMLKPVDYKQLEKRITHILNEADLRAKENAVRQQYKQQQGERIGEWLRYILSTSEEYYGEELCQLNERFGLGFSFEEHYILIWMGLPVEQGKEWEYMECMKEGLLDIFRSEGKEIYSSNFAEYNLFACVKCKDTDTIHIEKIRDRIAELTVNIKVPCCCFLSEILEIEQMIPMVRKLSERNKKNVLYQNKVILVGNRNIVRQERPVEIDYEKWIILLENREFEKLVSAVDFAVHSVVISGNMDAEALRDIYNHFMQIMYHYIGENFASRGGIVQEEQMAALQKRALNSVEDFRYFAGYFVNQIKQTIRMGNTDDVMNQVRRYIDEHLAEKISRTEIAKSVALNENYLSRLFHKENGCSISDYILQKRVVMAKKLLIQTKMSVSDIGEMVGYETTTYFIRIFKRETGKTPKEYRKDMKI